MRPIAAKGVSRDRSSMFTAPDGDPCLGAKAHNSFSPEPLRIQKSAHVAARGPVHHDEHPMDPQEYRFAAKQVEAPEAVFRADWRFAVIEAPCTVTLRNACSDGGII